MTVLAYALCGIVWGTTWFAIRVCIGPGGYPLILAAALRFTLAGPILLALYRWSPAATPLSPRARHQALGWIFVAGVFGATSYACVYVAEQHIPGGLAAVIFATSPLMVSALATMTRTETVTPRTVAGALVATLGVALIFWDRLNVSSTQAFSVTIVVVAVLASSIYSVVIKKHAGGLHPLLSTGAFLTSAGLLLFLPVFFYERRLPAWPPATLPTLALVYLTLVGTALVFTAYFYLIKRTSLMAVTTLAFVQPILALFLDAWLEHQIRLPPRVYAGIAVVLVGVLATSLKRGPFGRPPGTCPRG